MMMKNYLNTVSRFEKLNEKDVLQSELSDLQNMILPQDYALLVTFVNQLVPTKMVNELIVDYKKGVDGVVYWYKIFIDTKINIEYIGAKNSETDSLAITFGNDLLVLNNENKCGILAKRMNGKWVKDDSTDNLLATVSQLRTINSNSSVNLKERRKRFKLSDIENELNEELVSLIKKMFGYEFTVDYIKRDKNNQIEYLYLVSQMVQGNVIVLKYLREGCFTNKMKVEIDEKKTIINGKVSNDMLLQQQGEIGNRWYKVIAEKTLGGYWQTL